MSHNNPPVGKLLSETEVKDAIHFAIAPVVAGCRMSPGLHVQLVNGEAFPGPNPIGIVDPFLEASVKPGDRFFLFLYPGTITSLRHDWSHPAFNSVVAKKPDLVADKSVSIAWMTKWAVEHMGEDYYGDEGKRSPEVSYAAAIEAGHEKHIGPYESAREHIDDEWWLHWEKITGLPGERGAYFSCSC